MKRSCKPICDGMEDRLSGMPGNIHDCILSCLPICDAARTSILSRTWRYIWTSVPKLKFDTKFLQDMMIIKETDIMSRHYKVVSEKDIMAVPKVISDVLLMHNGPILEFSLDIPLIFEDEDYELVVLDLSSDIDRWLLFLSKNGVKKLSLKFEERNYMSETFKLPSSIFFCKTLKALSVSTCIFKPPHAFQGFQNLVKLCVRKVSFASGVSSNLLLNARELQKLEFLRCTGIQHLRIDDAPKLSSFCVIGTGEVDWQWFEGKHQFESVELFQFKEVESTNHGKTMNMEEFIGNLPRVHTLGLGGFSFKFLASHHVSARQLRTPAQNIRNLTLWLYPVCDLDQISSSLCLLRSCPNLEKLEMKVAGVKEDMVEPIVHCLQACESKDMKLHKLKTVTIQDMRGHKVELLIVKLLLASSTSLERMLIELRTEIGNEWFAVAKEVSMFSRVSMKAEVIIDETFETEEFL